MGVVGLAQEFKKRNNKTYIGAIIGKIVSLYPLKITIFDGKVLLQEKNLYINSYLLKDYSKDFVTGDLVKLTATEDGQKFFVDYKVVEL